MATQGELFRQFIEKKGLSDVAAGHVLGVSSEQISKYYESKTFQKPTLKKIQDAFPTFVIHKPKILLTDANKKFYQFRKLLKKTQTEMAEDLVLSQATIFRYENGELQPTPKSVKKLHDKFGMSLGWYYDGIGKPIDKSEKQGSLLKDIGTLSSKVDFLEKRVESLENTIKKLVKDFYAERAGV